MATAQIGNGWLNTRTGVYTVYDPATGQLHSKIIAGDPNQVQAMLRNPQHLQSVIERLQNGQLDVNRWFVDNPNGGNGFGQTRDNVNLQGQIGQAATAIQEQYPQMKWEDAMNYANLWVSERVAAGWDANQIEDMAKGALRDDKGIGGEMLKGINDRISRDMAAGKDPNATAAGDAQAGADPRGSIQDELRAFAGRMMSVLPPDSPQVQRIAELAQQAGNKYATQSGMGPGGITATGVAGVAARANVDLQTQREGIGAQALAAAGNQQLSVDQLQTQLQQMNQQAANSQAGGIGGLIGGAAGLIGGGIATAYGANPQVIPGLMQGGSSYGTGIATLASNGSQPPIQYGGARPRPGSSFKGRSWGTS